MTNHTLPDTTVILGIPIDNLDLNETIARIFTLAEDYELDGRPRTAVLVDIDTVICLNAGFQNVYDPDGRLINMLRQSDLMIPAGLPVAWAARIVGTRLKRRFSGEQLFRIFLSCAEKKEKSIFLPGNGTGSSQDAVQVIKQTHPDLKIAGTPAPAESKPRDLRDPLLEKINASATDFLILDVQEPATGAWFEKYRYRLYVPLTIVVIGTQGLIQAGRKKSPDRIHPFYPGKTAPGLPVLLPGIWKRFFYTSMMFGLTIMPLVLYQQYKQLAYKLFRTKAPVTSVKSHFSKSGRGIALRVISLPDPLDASVVEEIKQEIKHLIEIASKVVLDFSAVNFMDSSGLGLLLSLWRTAAAKDREIFIINIRPPVYRFLRLSRTLDFFEKNMCENIDDVIDMLCRRSDSAPFYYLALIRGNAAVFHMYGELDASRVIDMDFNAVIDTIGEKHAVFNLYGLDFIDSSGMQFFVKIHRYTAANGRTCILCGLREHVYQVFRILRLDRMFLITNDLSEAEDVLYRKE
ncbi:MAG: STAS domain-containing protein [Desulfobacterales bacterium]|nr:STAS domain-containing protein [Desulfobacterales bacterium]